LNDILNSQRSPNDKTRLGYDQDITFVKQNNDKQQIIYVDAIRSPLKGEYNMGNMVPLKSLPYK